MIGTYVLAICMVGVLAAWVAWMVYLIGSMYIDRPERLATLDWINDEKNNRFKGNRRARYEAHYNEHLRRSNG